MRTDERYKLVRIVWEDSLLGGGRWEILDTDEADASIPEIISVGYLISEKNNCKVLCAHISENDEHETGAYIAAGKITIPDCCIKEIKELNF